jgi:hypothetical protein
MKIVSYADRPMSAGGEKFVFFGDLGSGKTTALQDIYSDKELCPNGADDMLIGETEYGLESLKDDPPTRVLHLDTPNDVHKYLNAIQGKPRAFPFFALDSLTRYGERDAHDMAVSGVKGWEPWRAFGTRLVDHYFQLINECQPATVILVCRAEAVKTVADDMGTRSQWRPKLPGRMAGDNLPDKFDYLWYFGVHNTEEGPLHYIRTQPTETILARSRVPRSVNLPHQTTKLRANDLIRLVRGIPLATRIEDEEGEAF